jgi:hypothetical protein
MRREGAFPRFSPLNPKNLREDYALMVYNVLKAPLGGFGGENRRKMMYFEL